MVCANFTHATQHITIRDKKMTLEISKEWAMPSANTFNIKPINKFVRKHIKEGIVSIDPFSNINRLASITNDLDPEAGSDYCMDALEFLKTFKLHK